MNCVYSSSKLLAALAVLLAAPLAFGSSGNDVGAAVGGDSNAANIASNHLLPLSESTGTTGLLGLALDRTFVFAQSAAEGAPTGRESSDAAALAKKLANPVASLISVPLQFNYDEGFGPKDAYKLTLNIQPVIPVSLNDEWNLIVRTIVPVVYQDSPATGIDSSFGLGDTVQSLFFSPKAPTKGGWIWGVGPVFLWPTGTDDSLGSEKWGAGPTGLILRQEKGWTYGVLANHIWSYAGDGARNSVNATFVQPFLVYTFPTATGIGINTETTYDWSNEQWTVPINVFVNQVVKFGKQPVQFQVGPRYYAEAPDGGPEWGVRFAITFLFPR
jgi:hypothetical protein